MHCLSTTALIWIIGGSALIGMLTGGFAAMAGMAGMSRTLWPKHRKLLYGGSVIKCATCHRPIRGWDDLMQVPAGIIHPELTGTVTSSELINYHRQCCEYTD